MSSPEETSRSGLIGPVAIVALILTIAALRAGYAIAMPIAFAGMILAAIWPTKMILDRRFGGWLSYFLTVLILLLVFAIFAATVYLAIGQLWSVLGAKWDEVTHGYQAIVDQAGRMGLPVGTGLDPERLLGVAEATAGKLYSFFTYLGFIAIIVILGMPEVPRMRARLGEELSRRTQGRLVDVFSSSAGQVRGYLVTTLTTSAITGIASAAFSFSVELELPLVWGLLNFVLNFVPVIGNIVGILPPVLYALTQFDGYAMPLAVLAGFSILQFTISNFLYPYMQGRQLSISPVAIIVAMAFWSWMWGIAGALIAVPLTTTLTIICRHFENTQWIAALIAKD